MVFNSTTSSCRLLLGFFFQLLDEYGEAEFNEFSDASGRILLYEPMEDSVD